MSLYSSHMITRKALIALAPTNKTLPGDWFNWSYAPPQFDELGSTRRIEFVETGNAPEVEVWYRRVVKTGLVPTIIVTTDDEMSSFQDDETNLSWGGVTPLFEGILLTDENENLDLWRKRLQQPDDVALASWIETRRGGGINQTRVYQRVPEFARCYGEELKRWIEIKSNAELITKQWQDPCGWPDGCPALALEDMELDTKRWSRVGDAVWVPMKRLPFCEIGYSGENKALITNGLLPHERNRNGKLLFDESGELETALVDLCKKFATKTLAEPVGFALPKILGETMRRVAATLIEKMFGQSGGAVAAAAAKKPALSAAIPPVVQKPSVEQLAAFKSDDVQFDVCCIDNKVYLQFDKPEAWKYPTSCEWGDGLVFEIGTPRADGLVEIDRLTTTKAMHFIDRGATLWLLFSR